MFLIDPYRFAPPVLWTPLNIPTSTRLLFFDGSDSSRFSLTGSTVNSYTSPEGLIFNGTNASISATGFNGGQSVNLASGYLTSTAAASTWNGLHNGTLHSIHLLLRPESVTNTTVYSILGTGTASTNVGFFAAYDNRSASSRFNRLSYNMFRGVSGTSVITTNLASADNFMTANTYQIISILSDPANATAANRSYLRRDEGTALQNNASTGAVSTANASFTLQIGAGGNNVLPFIGGYAAAVILVGADAHSIDLRNRIAGWMAHVFYRLRGAAVPLPVSHPYYAAPPYV